MLEVFLAILSASDVLDVAFISSTGFDEAGLLSVDSLFDLSLGALDLALTVDHNFTQN